MKVGLKIRELRKQHKHTLTYLSERLNVDKAHLSRMETGKSPINLDTIERISKIYNVKSSYFFDDDFTEDEQEFLEDINKKLTPEDLLNKYTLEVEEGKAATKEDIEKAIEYIKFLMAQRVK